MSHFDFISAIGRSTRYTFHSHTEFCDGRDRMETFARKAVEEGFSHYGFSPHSPVPIASPCNMTREHVADFDREFARIKSLYGHTTRFYRAMEIDYLGPQWCAADPYFTDLGLDYSISSVHFIPAQGGEYVDIDGRFDRFRRNMAYHFHNDIGYVVHKFYEQSMEMISRGGFDIIGHYDRIGHNASHFHEGIEQEGWYQDLRKSLTDEIISSGVTVEINTKALADHHRFFPAPDVWSNILEAGVPIVVNSDAHVADLINAGREEAINLLNSMKCR